jgi:hypothetical protein
VFANSQSGADQLGITVNYKESEGGAASVLVVPPIRRVF